MTDTMTSMDCTPDSFVMPFSRNTAAHPAQITSHKRLAIYQRYQNPRAYSMRGGSPSIRTSHTGKAHGRTLADYLTSSFVVG